MFNTLAKRASEILFDKPLPPPSPHEAACISRLRESFQLLPIADTDCDSASGAAWNRNMNQLRSSVLEDDPRQFLRWKIINSTMFISYAGYVRDELSHLRRSRNWNTRWKPAIKESRVGRPLPYLFYPASSGNLIHHAYHLCRHEEATGLPVSAMDFIFEFGGGYGSTCRLAHQLGFRGRYIIFDLPPFSALQKFYLESLGLPTSTRSSGQKNGFDALCISGMDTLHNELGKIVRGDRSMFIATWSLSETPPAVRDAVTPLLSCFHSFLIAYQHRFEDVENVEYFHRWKNEIPGIAWRDSYIDHLPGNSYLIGYKESTTRTLKDAA